MLEYQRHQLAQEEKINIFTYGIVVAEVANVNLFSYKCTFISIKKLMYFLNNNNNNNHRNNNGYDDDD